MKKSVLWFLRIVGFFLFAVGCASKPDFQVENGERKHIESGITVPEKVAGWVESSVDERLSQEIVACMNYDKELQPDGPEAPRSSIFLMKSSSTQNLKVVENRIVATNRDLKLLKTDTVRLKNKKRVLMSTYSLEFETSGTGGSGVKVRKKVKRQYIFATHLKDSTKVILSVYNPSNAKEKDQAYEFVQTVLFPFVKR